MSGFTVLLLCACSFEFSEQARDGDLLYEYGNKKAFVARYYWDGRDETRTVVIPQKYEGRKLVSVGGFAGRGLPMPFYVDITRYFPEDTVFLKNVDDEDISEVRELQFTLILPGSIEDVHLAFSESVVEEDGKLIEYRVNVETEYAK